ncbi:MAG: transglutaminase domain-containing protein [Candidatus Latescibacteria bacterium]|nr:transglutaminase domain-containing protein [Candidatus Latescibacterota bacterium]
MGKNIAPVTLIFVFIICTRCVFGDTASKAYVDALARGDYVAAGKAQSFLAPPYCYDLNPWHGVTFIKAVNGKVVTPYYPFVYQDMTHLKVRKLYGRAGIEEMVRSSETELGLIQHISDWANKQWGHIQPLPYAAWDALEILDRVEKGDAFWCTYKAALFVQACNAAGLTARMLGINPKHKAAHTVTDVYSNEFRKWILVDPWLNCYFERDGIPLSALEYHDAVDNYDGIYLVFGENGKGTEYWDYKTGKTSTIPHAGKRIPLAEDNNKGLIEFYYDIRVVMRNDHTVHPQSKENVYVDGFMVPYNARGGEWWGPQLHWIDDTTMPQITAANSGERNDFEWPLNEVKTDLKKISPTGEPVVLEARFSTLTPNFSHYELEVDGSAVPIDGDVFIWRLKKGTNSLKIVSVNDTERSGFQSEFVIAYDPDSVDFSKRVNVELKNPGMESIDEKSTGNDRKPAGWGTITSNALRFKEFILDSKVKHTGRYSLKATPAVDSERGYEYAFIVKSADLDVNPSTDVIYTIWLRASEDKTPVDIALLESTYKGQGTYVERVEVGREWKKYELRCRLNNELTKAYVGFKVYSGTIWADDAQFIEVK